MTDQPETPEGENEPNVDEILDSYLTNIENAIAEFLALLGELDGTMILTDWAIVCATQGWDEETGRPVSAPTHIFPKRHMPTHRTKGLLVDGLDQLKLTESTVEFASIMTVLGRDDDEDDDGANG